MSRVVASVTAAPVLGPSLRVALVAAWILTIFLVDRHLVVNGINTGSPAISDLVLVVDSSAESVTQVYFDIGHGFNEAESDSEKVLAGPGPQKLTFTLPEAELHALRLDPLQKAGRLHVREGAIVSRDNPAEQRRLDFTKAVPLHEIAALHPGAGELKIETTPNAVDPQLQLPIDPPYKGGLPTLGKRIIGLVGVDLSLTFGWLVIGAAVYAIARKTGIGQGSKRRSKAADTADAIARDRGRGVRPFLIGVGGLSLALLLFGALLFYQAQTFYLELPMRANQAVEPELFYDLGKGLDAENSVRVKLPAAVQLTLVRFALPHGVVKALRFDPASISTTTWVGRGTVRCEADSLFGAKRTRATFEFKDFHALKDVAAMTPEEDGSLRIEVAPGATDPNCLLDLPAPLDLNFDGRAFWLRFTPALIGYAVSIIALFILWRRAENHGTKR